MLTYVMPIIYQLNWDEMNSLKYFYCVGFQALRHHSDIASEVKLMNKERDIIISAGTEKLSPMFNDDGKYEYHFVDYGLTGTAIGKRQGESNYTICGEYYEGRSEIKKIRINNMTLDDVKQYLMDNSEDTNFINGFLCETCCKLLDDFLSNKQ